MIKLGDMTTGVNHGAKKLWLLKSMEIYHNISKKECYVVLGLIDGFDGWYTLFNGTLKQCREFIGSEAVITE